jgi:hypothetical protein
VINDTARRRRARSPHAGAGSDKGPGSCPSRYEPGSRKSIFPTKYT